MNVNIAFVLPALAALVVAGCGDPASPPARPALPPVAPAAQATAGAALERAATQALATQAAARPAADPTSEDAKAEAVRLLGAAGSARAAGDLGIAWELGRQAVAKWPAYTEAQQFVADVATQKQAAEDAAVDKAANNGWSSGARSFIFQFYYAKPNTTFLAATCAAENTIWRIPYDDYVRRQRANDPALGQALYSFLERCKADALDIPLH
jgi:hypothetical protein